MPEKHSIELHFREGFDGQAIEVMVNGQSVSSFTARTRIIIARAHIEKLKIDEGDSVVVRIGSTQWPVSVVKGVTQYAIDLRGGELNIEPARHKRPDDCRGVVVCAAQPSRAASGDGPALESNRLFASFPCLFVSVR